MNTPIGPTLTIAAAAKHLDLTEGAMRMLVDAKLFPATRTPQGWFVTRASVDRVLAEVRLCDSASDAPPSSGAQPTTTARVTVASYSSPSPASH